METVTLKTVPPVKIFNLPIYEHHLVIDIRQKEHYDGGRIVSAVSFPSLPLSTEEKEREAHLARFIVDLVKECSVPDNPSPVVVYGPSDDCSLAHVEWLANRLSKLKSASLTVAVLRDSCTEGDSHDFEGDFDPLEYFCRTIVQKTSEIWWIDGGYTAFQMSYPFLCGDISFASMPPIPHEITPNVYMGSRAMSYSKQELDTLGMTHLVAVKGHPKVDWQSLNNVPILICDVEDTSSQQMYECWAAVTQFITDAMAENQSSKVLVYIHGRSKSAGVIMAYLIRALGFSLSQAWEHMLSITRKVDRSLVNYDQLTVWSKQQRSIKQHGSIHAV